MILTPTERLTIYVLRDSPTPMPLSTLTVAVGSTPATMIKIAATLVHKGCIKRELIGGISYYTPTAEVQA